MDITYIYVFNNTISIGTLVINYIYIYMEFDLFLAIHNLDDRLEIWWWHQKVIILVLFEKSYIVPHSFKVS